MVPEVVKNICPITKLFAPHKFREISVVCVIGIAVVMPIALEMSPHWFDILSMGTSLGVDKIAGMVHGEMSVPLKNVHMGKTKNVEQSQFLEPSVKVVVGKRQFFVQLRQCEVS